MNSTKIKRRTFGQIFAAERVPIYVAAWLVVLLGSLLSLLNFHEYPVWSAEIGLIAAGIGVAALVLGLLHSDAARLRPLMDAALVFLAVDLNFDGPYAAAAALATALVAIVAKRSVAPVVAVVFSVVVVGQLLTPLTADARVADAPPTSGFANSRLPAVIHIVLDEHIGIEGLRIDPPLAALRAPLLDSYIGNGFSVFGGAYSRHFHTINSLPEILNFGESEIDSQSRANRESRIEDNAYFDALQARGYQINVYQSDFVDYCGHKAVTNCETYRRSNLQPIAKSSLSPGERARIISSAYVSLSDALVRVSRVYDHYAVMATNSGVRLPSLNIDMVRLGSTLASLDAAHGFVRDIASATPGRAYFIHLVFPHYPHATRPDCSVKPLAEWRYRQFGGDLASRNAGYADQLLCTARLVDEILGAVERSPAAGNNVFVVHGDHGSRITVADPKITNIDTVDRRDLIVGYSALFAVRTVNGAGAYEPRMAAVSSLLKRFSNNGMTAPPVVGANNASREQVYIEDGAWRPIFLRPLPDFGKTARLREN